MPDYRGPRAPEVPATISRGSGSLRFFRFRDLEIVENHLAWRESIDWGARIEDYGWPRAWQTQSQLNAPWGLVLKEKDDITRIRRDGTPPKLFSGGETLDERSRSIAGIVLGIFAGNCAKRALPVGARSERKSYPPRPCGQSI